MFRDPFKFLAIPTSRTQLRCQLPGPIRPAGRLPGRGCPGVAASRHCPCQPYGARNQHGARAGYTPTHSETASLVLGIKGSSFVSRKVKYQTQV